ncbi:hypothetical protein ADIARSV_0869 [Arcticibacter svalbardensis MN12-7]|uniref:Glycosyl transferase family 1 domain-containing protein n=2 Tax=Arcticibacter TaxID=1288026 RepID=R9H467_9SPHI|nr:hypothetical protein ADIARSV_0869 [Arcticibacter svalbardensis MN12-7]
MEYCIDKEIKTIILNRDMNSIEPKWVLVYRLITDSIESLSHLKELRSADTIISVSYITVPLLFFRKLGLLKKQISFIWEGFFLHNQKFFSLFKKLFRHLFRQNDALLVYSQFERDLYSQSFNINISNIHYIPLVFEPKPQEILFNQYTKKADWDKIPDEFYFSGGYSHRDYATLIEVFRTIDATLVICYSGMNTEIQSIDIPANVILLHDVSREDFAELVRRSKACLLLIKSNSGAAGQLFVIEVMYNNKIIIASSTDILKEMITHRENGFIVNDPILEIPLIIKDIEEGVADVYTMKRKAKETILSVNCKRNYNHHLNQAFRTVTKYHN